MNLPIKILQSLFMLLILVSTASSSPPEMNYSGRLTDTIGDPVPDGSYNITFLIYDDSISGTVVWTETRSVSTTKGLFSVNLGEVLPLTELVFSTDSRWLSMQVNGDPEILPRTMLTTTPYSHKVSTLDGATGGSVVGDLEVDGELSIIGPGVRFPDGTLQSSAASSFDPLANILNTSSLFVATGAPLSVPILTTPDGEATYITKLTISTNSISDRLLTFRSDSEILLTLWTNGAFNNEEWSSDGGAPLLIPANATLYIDDSGTSSGTTFWYSFQGYQL